ncbi:hypothetical protein Tsubulata_007340 [Turnera subulata]|uniref:Uncharacterized protein n=1 Tax=Turnera subulata TaxID=218843 RepID=A0A9Q0FN01_9ROSI|nr:hypothetical protein Tsubulata_007340 [Turnera subulata]
MLQWMGGSRRKIATSRKSTQKRQKQYFEQKRRQQQQQRRGGFESYEEGGGDFSAAAEAEAGRRNNNGERRSLDILSLRSLSSLSQENKPAVRPVGTEEAPKVNASPAKFYSANDSPVIFADRGSLKAREARITLGYQAETSSPKRAPITSPDSSVHAFKGNDKKPDDAFTATQQSLGLFDLLGDEKANENLEVNPVYESHAAFSVEGLGQVEAETPPHSPQQPSRYVSYGRSSHLKAAQHLKASKSLQYVLDDIELEVDSVMQDINRPMGGRSEYSTGVQFSYSPKKKNAFPSKIHAHAHAQFDGRTSEMRGSFCGNISDKNANSNVDMWDDRSSLFHDNAPREREYDMSWDRWPCQLDADSNDFSKFGDDEMTDYADYASKGPNLSRKWATTKCTEEVGIFDSPSLKQRTTGYDCSFLMSERPRHHSVATNFDIKDATTQPEWSCFMTEDAKDNLSLLSEESSSSTAVMGEAIDIPLSNFAARSNEGFLSASGSDYDAKSFAKRNHFRKNNDNQKGNSAPGKSRWMPMQWESKSTGNFDYPLQDKSGSHKRRLFEEGHGPADVHLGLSSACQTSEAEHSPFISKPWAEDVLDAFPVDQPNFDFKPSFNSSKHGRPFKCSPSGNIISEESMFYKPSIDKHFDESLTFSKVQFGPTKPEFSPDYPDLGFEVRPSDSCFDASSHGEIPNLSAQESASKDYKNRSKTQQGNHEKSEAHEEIPVEQKVREMYAVDFEEDGPESEETKDGGLETSSSVKMSAKSESSVDGKRYQDETEVSLPRLKGDEEIENRGPSPKINEGVVFFSLYQCQIQVSDIILVLY